MDQLCSTIQNLILLPIENKNKYQNLPNKCKSVIICTPELCHYLDEIMYKCAIIKTAFQFVPPENLIRKDKNYETRIQTAVEIGNQILTCLKYHLGLENVVAKPDSEVRARIPDEVEKLFRLNQQLEPLFDIAQQSIKSTNDHLGITDRLFGYRTNLSRNGQCNYRQRYTFELHDSSRPEMAPRFNIPGWNTWKVECSRSNSKYDDSEEFRRWEANAVERAGIEPNYPGQSETRSAFTKPPRPITDVLDNHGKVVPCQPGYRINPNPNLEELGYRLPKVKNFEKQESEYMISFQYPDAKKVIPHPWKRSEY